MMVLLATTLISALMGELANALTIIVIVILNVILGFMQEYKTEKSIEALKKLAAPLARVLRDGKEKEVEAFQIVIDDVILLEVGDKVPADALLVESHNFRSRGIKSDRGISTCPQKSAFEFKKNDS